MTHRRLYCHLSLCGILSNRWPLSSNNGTMITCFAFFSVSPRYFKIRLSLPLATGVVQRYLGGWVYPLHGGWVQPLPVDLHKWGTPVRLVKAPQSYIGYMATKGSNCFVNCFDGTKTEIQRMNAFLIQARLYWRLGQIRRYLGRINSLNVLCL